jgi:hypothetical protein
VPRTADPALVTSLIIATRCPSTTVRCASGSRYSTGRGPVVPDRRSVPRKRMHSRVLSQPSRPRMLPRLVGHKRHQLCTCANAPRDPELTDGWSLAGCTASRGSSKLHNDGRTRAGSEHGVVEPTKETRCS